MASVSSAVAAVVVGQIWRPGAIIGAAVTPVVVAVTSELLRRPAQTVTAVRTRARERPRGARAAPPPSSPEDRFGIWEADRPARGRGGDRRRRALRLAVVTGLVAFVIGAVALTTGELVFGGSVGGGERTTVFGGRDRGGDREERERTTTTEDGATEQEQERAPTTTEEESTEEPAPTTTGTTPAPTTPTTPATPTAPGAPATPETAPEAAPTTPAPGG